jgi:hypothetical protein
MTSRAMRPSASVSSVAPMTFIVCSLGGLRSFWELRNARIERNKKRKRSATQKREGKRTRVREENEMHLHDSHEFVHGDDTITIFVEAQELQVLVPLKLKVNWREKEEWIKGSKLAVVLCDTRNGV